MLFFYGTPREVVNEKIGLNEVVSNFQAGEYQEVVVEGGHILAKKPEQAETIGSKTVKTVAVDKVMLPPKDSLKDL